MAQPTPYERSFDFTGFSASNPNGQQPGVSLDSEFDDIKATIDALLENIAILQRDDTRIRNESVGIDQLDATVFALLQSGSWQIKGSWETAQSYVKGDVVTDSDVIYLIMRDHVSGVLATDVAADKIVAIFDPGDSVLRNDLALATGAGLVFATGGISVQAALNSKVSLAALTAASGASGIGSTGPSNVQDDLDARATYAELAASSGASLVNVIQQGTGAQSRSLQTEIRERGVSIKQFGAVGNGIADDSDAIDAAVDYALSVGGILRIPRGYYRVTRTINIGLQVYTNYAEAIALVQWDACTINAANKAANALKPKLDIIGEAGSVLIGDWAPSVPTPILAYNLDNDSLDETARIENLTIIAANQFNGTKIVPAAYVANNLIGLFTGRGADVVSNFTHRGLGTSHLSLASYWCTHQGLKAYDGGTAFIFNDMNAGLAQQLNAVRCLKGYILTGQNAKYTVFGAENCDEELSVPRGDTSRFGPAYLEDVRATGGAGLHQAKIGENVDGAGDVIHCVFENILTNNNLANGKKAYRFRAAYFNTFNGCRAYSNTSTVDTVSTNGLYGCDFTIPQFSSDAVREGTFTPVLADTNGNTFTASTAVGRWFRIGNRAWEDIHIVWTSKGSVTADPLILTGSPLAARNISGYRAAGEIGEQSGFDITPGAISVDVSGNQQFLVFRRSVDDAVSAIVAANSCQETGSINLSISYLV